MNDVDLSDKALFKNIYKKNKMKEIQKIKTYNTVLCKCEKKIKWAANNDQFHIFFEIPRFCLSCPLYNIEECTFFIIQKLKTKFKVHQFTPEQLKQLGIKLNHKYITSILYIFQHHPKCFS